MSVSRKKTIAKARWKFIYQALKKQSSRESEALSGDNISIMRFKSFDLLQQTLLPKVSTSEDALWSQFAFDGCPQYSLKIRTYICLIQQLYLGQDGYILVQWSAILSAGWSRPLPTTVPTSLEQIISRRQLQSKPSAQDLIGFNNTGNVCVWPSEEVLAYYCLNNVDFFESKSVCELGGGMTCLAGYTVASTSNSKEVLVTDGNLKSCQNAEVIAEMNQAKFGRTKVSVRQLLWNNEETFKDLKGQFDIVIGADCFFFDEYRQDLLNTMKHILKPEGVAWMFAPQRGSTLKQFEQMAREDFSTSVEENYDPKLWQKHLELKSSSSNGGCYDEDIHYPLLMTLKKR